jgi:hypothetical protein
MAATIVDAVINRMEISSLVRNLALPVRRADTLPPLLWLAGPSS